ncbi:hypothetical protein HDV00_007834 [Rhizophlyctis rosea]|nr:hypothetical protein HDV00_007834 [Rhizophlyctis rosea]
MVERFNSGTVVEAVELEKKVASFLYADDHIHCINEEFEETSIPVDLLVGGAKVLPFLQDSTPITIQYHDGQPITAAAPDRLKYRVAETMLAQGKESKGSGVVFKAATLDNGATLQVPEFINPGDEILVDVQEQKYVSKAK